MNAAQVTQMWSDAMEMQKDEMQKARPQRQEREVDINLSGGTVLQNFLLLSKSEPRPRPARQFFRRDGARSTFYYPLTFDR